MNKDNILNRLKAIKKDLKLKIQTSSVKKDVGALDAAIKCFEKYGE